MKTRLRLVSALAYAVGIGAGVIALVPDAAASEPVTNPYWHCEWCRCAFPQGVCECYNCTFY